MRARRAAAVVVAFAAAVAIARRKVRRQRAGIPTSPAERFGSVAVAAGRAGATTLVGQGRSVFLGIERDVTLRDRWQAATVDEVVASLGQMRGAMMKLGQMASYLDQSLPASIRERFAQLQADAPAMAPGLAASIVEDELGAPPEELFATWDPEPFAAASIGQVHRAVTRSGEPVAVKVQYPGIADSMTTDLAGASLLFAAMRPLFPGLDGDVVIAEVLARVLEECDYLLEADRQERFAAHFAGHPHIHIPAVHRDLSSSRVLTTELVAATTLAGTAGWPQRERDLAGETIYRFTFNALYGMGAFNGDPHPGNYLFHGGGRVTFLDFGLVKELTNGEVARFAVMTKAMVWDRDPAAFRRATEAAGYLPDGLDVPDEEVVAHFAPFWAFVERDEPFTMTPDFASSTLHRMFDAGGPHRAIVQAGTIPAHAVILQRINVGLAAVLAELGATANWRRIGSEVWPWTTPAPTDPMARAHVQWQQDRHGGPTPPGLGHGRSEPPPPC